MLEYYPTFVSTSTDFTLCASYAKEAQGKVAIFSQIFGKDITALSKYPAEQEYLSLPVKIESKENSDSTYPAKLKKGR